MNKNTLLLIFGIITGLFILPGILKWLGLPSFADVLTLVLGEPNVINRVIVSVVGVILITFLLLSIKKMKNE